MHLIYPNIVRTVSIKFMKFIAPDTIFSLFSPLDTGVFVVIATALHSWGPWVVNWDRELSGGEIVYKKVYKSGKAPCGCNKTWCPGPRGFSWNFSPLSMFEVIVPAPLISLTVLAKKIRCWCFLRWTLVYPFKIYYFFCREKKLKKTALHSYNIWSYVWPFLFPRSLVP